MLLKYPKVKVISAMAMLFLISMSILLYLSDKTLDILHIRQVRSISLAMHIDFLATFSLMAALLVTVYLLIGYWMVRPVRYQAEHDQLTGLYNQATFRRFFSDMADQLRDRAIDIVMLSFDLDNFKSINDNYGHEKGDEVLKALSVILQKHVRKLDIPGRMGGEEFGVILPSCSVDTAVRIAEEIREEVLGVHVADDRYLSVSVGVCSNTIINGYSCKDLSHGADTAMYLAKRTGKNKVVVYDPSIKMEDLEKVSGVH